MKVSPENAERVLNADLIATEGAGEIIGGSQREENIDVLLARIRHEGLPEADYEWYLDTRRFGSVPHSGFGMGVERMVRWVSGVEHIRECIPFPRTINRLRP
jgi:asparaginyl-tRNA synthetase